MKMFTQSNTDGYTDEQLSRFNAELAERLQGLDPLDDEYQQTESDFSDEIARR
jgi:hypothetical protein